MFHSRKLNKKINKLHERAFRIVYKDDYSIFNDLLATDGSSYTIHHHNLQLLAVEMYKINNNLSPEFMHDIIHYKTY